MDFAEILHCKNCSLPFDCTKRKPLLLKCGHTFCEVCIKSLYDCEKILCPLDFIPSPFEDFTHISTNYLILELIESTVIKKSQEKTCQVHKAQVIRFFCQTHRTLLCQECLILHHLGSDHNIMPSDSIVLIDPLKLSIENMISRVKIDIERINSRIKENSEELKRYDIELNVMKKGLEELIVKNYSDILAKKQKEFELETIKIQKFNEKAQKLSEQALEIQSFLANIPPDYSYVTSTDNELLQKLKQYESFLLENSDFNVILPNIKPNFPFMEPPLLSKDDMNELIRVQIPSYDKKNRKLLTILKEEGVLKSDIVFQTMMIVNRRYFVSESMINRAYQDNPLSIGWNTTISAPHMHAQTLEELKVFLKKATKAIDIGCGSGYITACMAELMGENGKVYGIDHIEEIVNFAKNNLKKKNDYLLESKRVEFIKADGRKGYPELGPYDVMHVGGAIQNVPQEMLNQLAKGGRMWVPVGASGCQAIYVYDKDMNGNVKSQKLFNVAYGMLTTMEIQLQQQMF